MNNSVINEVTNNLIKDMHWKTLSLMNNNWASDPIFENYHKLGNKQKGVLGEYFVENYMKSLKNSVVQKARSTGHDRIIDGHKTEIKFSLANSTGKVININRFMINHVSIGKDWDRLIFCGINPLGCGADRVRMYYFNKEDFKNYMLRTSSPIFKHQQAGAKGGNDDYICTKFDEFAQLPFIKEVDSW
jgi:hypothetical protein|tara:strand:- start:544 stop:1107 length:564 start_codon:yes stop_codon:yes gene_type:complete